MFKIFFPPACPLCLQTLPQESALPFCRECERGITPLAAARCLCCALPFAGSENSSHLCSRCLVDKPPYRKVFCYGHYQGRLRDAIHQFKFEGKVGLDRALGGLVSQAIDSRLQYDLIVPVALHPESLRSRSYNQALLLAREVARLRRWRVDHRLLRKVRETRAQHDLTAGQRTKNLRGAFQVTGDVSKARILLVDDVLTTGATATACCQALLAAGAEGVDVGVVARAV